MYLTKLTCKIKIQKNIFLTKDYNKFAEVIDTFSVFRVFTLILIHMTNISHKKKYISN